MTSINHHSEKLMSSALNNFATSVSAHTGTVAYISSGIIKNVTKLTRMAVLFPTSSVSNSILSAVSDWLTTSSASLPTARIRKSSNWSRMLTVSTRLRLLVIFFLRNSQEHSHETADAVMSLAGPNRCCCIG